LGKGSPVTSLNHRDSLWVAKIVYLWLIIFIAIPPWKFNSTIAAAYFITVLKGCWRFFFKMLPSQVQGFVQAVDLPSQ